MVHSAERFEAPLLPKAHLPHHAGARSAGQPPLVPRLANGAQLKYLYVNLVYDTKDGAEVAVVSPDQDIHLPMNPFERPASLYPRDIAIDPEHQTRLVDILPGHGNAKIVCKTAAYLLNDEPRHDLSPPTAYDALSYVWGKWDTAARIQVNEISDFPVTRNLFNALLRLRPKNEPRRLWIDQICIDQQCHDERKAQVRQMGRIFGQAWRVIVWLGDTDDQHEVTGEEPVPRMFTRPEMTKALARAVKTELVEPWWTRAWVVEEYALAREAPLAMFGPYMMEWEKMMRVADHAERLPGDFYHRLGARFERFGALRLHKDNLPVPIGLHPMSVVLKDTTTSDPRDKIFCILPTLPEDQRKLIGNRRDRSVAEIFTRATYVSIFTSGNLGILSLVTRLSCPDTKYGLPSWAVDFTFPDTKHTMRFAHFAAGGRFEKYHDKWLSIFQDMQSEMLWSVYDFDFNLKSWTRNHPQNKAQVKQFDFDPSKLVLTALELDTVQDAVSIDTSLGLKDFATPGNSFVQPYVKMLGGTASSGAVRWIDSRSYNAEEREVLASVDARLHHFNPYLLLDAAQDQKLNSPLLEPSAKPRRVRVNMLDAIYRRWDAAARPREAKPIEEMSVQCFYKDLRDSFASESKNDNFFTKIGDRGEATKDNVWFRMLSTFDTRGMTFFVTAAGFIGTGPVDLMDEDRIVLPYGSPYPIALRQSGSGGWLFVGFCYVRGIMDQELYDFFQDLELEEKKYILV